MSKKNSFQIKIISKIDQFSSFAAPPNKPLSLNLIRNSKHIPQHILHANVFTMNAFSSSLHCLQILESIHLLFLHLSNIQFVLWQYSLWPVLFCFIIVYRFRLFFLSICWSWKNQWRSLHLRWNLREPFHYWTNLTIFLKDFDQENFLEISGKSQKCWNIVK